MSDVHIDAEGRAPEKAPAQFEPLLASYAKSANLHSNGASIRNVEDALLELLKNPMNRYHTDRLLVALAGVAGAILCAHDAVTIMPDSPARRKKIRAALDRGKERGLRRSVTWLASSESSPRFLRDLYDLYFPLETKDESVASPDPT